MKFVPVAVTLLNPLFPQLTGSIVFIVGVTIVVDI